MATKVNITLNSHPLSREENGIVFLVSNDDGKVGELLVSKGGVRWKPKGKQKNHFASWTEMDGFMTKQKIK